MSAKWRKNFDDWYFVRSFVNLRIYDIQGYIRFLHNIIEPGEIKRLAGIFVEALGVLNMSNLSQVLTEDA